MQQQQAASQGRARGSKLRSPMAIDLKVIDELLAEYQKPEDIIGENGLLKQLTKALLERALQGELTAHLGYKKHEPGEQRRSNARNGKTSKTLKGDFGEITLETPRDQIGRAHV